MHHTLVPSCGTTTSQVSPSTAPPGSTPAEEPRCPVEDRPLHEVPVPLAHEVVDVAEGRLEEEGLVGGADLGELVTNERPEAAAAADRQHSAPQAADARS